MAFGITTATSSRASNAVDDSVTLPASVASGDLCLAFHYSDGSITRTFPSPWVEIKDFDGGTTTFSIGVAYLIATGGETAVTVTKSATERFTAIAMRITAATWHGTTPPEISSTDPTGSDAAPDPPSVTASWGSEANLFIAINAFNNSAAGVSTTVWPTNYSGNNVESPDISSAGRGAIGTFETTAASDDPGAFTLSATNAWWAGTVVVRPAGGAPPAFSPPHYLMTIGMGR